MAHLVNTPPDARLWYDDRDIAFLREDAKDLVEIQSLQVTMINSLLTNGWDQDQAVRAVMSGDLMALIGNHSGLFSVQLQSLEAIQAAAEAASQSAIPAADDGEDDDAEPARAVLRGVIERELRRSFYTAELPRGRGEGSDRE